MCDYSTLASQAKSAAAAAGVNLSAYARYVYAFPGNACTRWGLGTIGGNPSQAWINGTPFSVKVIGHEMGHNLGLYHSRALECGTTTLGTNCSILEYGNALDMTPTTASWSDPALDVGQTFSDPNTGVTIAPTWTSATGATMGVTFGPMACVRANPAITLSPSQSQWVQSGTIVTYTVSVTNKDNGGCAASNITLQVAAPSGWTAAFAASALTVNPGAMASTTLQVTSPTFATSGFYTIGVTATNGGAPTYLVSTLATYAIVSSLNVAVSTDKASYARNQTVTITAVVSANGSAVANAGVTVTITKPGGAKVAGSSVSGANGSVVFKYRIGRRDPVGTYQISASANLNNAITGSSSASFRVQ